ncbi:unnamed protein product [Dovyalis caffra]|uniref:Uncharacterized protein n=1 Tax=Dovyalis caffra TaxID=77055 RepID=A0AAV1QLP9_9ROSI|nr:unnamed protein product [Dovyalis caffra]
MKQSIKEDGNQLGKERLATPYTFHGLPRLVGLSRASGKLNPTMTVTLTIRATDASPKLQTHISTTQAQRHHHFIFSAISPLNEENMSRNQQHLLRPVLSCREIAAQLSRPIHYRKRVLPLFDTVKRVGIEVDGVEKLGEIGPA